MAISKLKVAKGVMTLGYCILGLVGLGILGLIVWLLWLWSQANFFSFIIVVGVVGIVGGAVLFVNGMDWASGVIQAAEAEEERERERRHIEQKIEDYKALHGEDAVPPRSPYGGQYMWNVSPDGESLTGSIG